MNRELSLKKIIDELVGDNGDKPMVNETAGGTLNGSTGETLRQYVTRIIKEEIEVLNKEAREKNG